MNRLLIILLLTFSGNQILHAQYEQLLNKTYAERRDLVRDFYIREMLDPQRDMGRIQKKVNDIKQLAQENDDEDLEFETGLMQLHINLNNENKNIISKVLRQVDSLQKIAIVKNVTWLEARLESFAHLACFETEYNYELAFDYQQQLEETLNKVSQKDFPEKQVCFLQMGWAYFFFHDYETAIRIWKKGLLEKPEKSSDQFFIELNNNIGVSFQKLNFLDSSSKYFTESFRCLTFKKESDSIWFGILKGNLAENLFANGKYDEALSIFKVVERIGIKYSEKGIVANANSYLAAIYLERKLLDLTYLHLTKARYYIQDHINFTRLEKLFPLYAKWHSLKGNYQTSVVYLDSAMQVSDSLKNKLNALQILRGHEKAEMLQQRILHEEKRIKTMQRNFLIVFVFILTAIAIYIFMQQRKKFKQQQQIQELELKQRENDLILANSQLDDFATAISEKQQLVDELLEKLGTSVNTDAIVQLQQSTILTDEEWEQFKNLFEQVHSGYLIRLKEKLPDLSPAETRFMVLAKLKFSNKEMAATLGITQQAVRTTWYRLRKKLQLPEEGSPEELVSKI